ncbi:MAG: O-antigen ligase family protein [Chloroflexi bacterium]|nr:MAG: O-antigen ligase family protein [Chloroflexota bacterium]
MTLRPQRLPLVDPHGDTRTPIVALVVAICAGAIVAFVPMAGLVVVGVAVAMTLVITPSLPSLFLAALSVLLAGYGFFGRSFAYLGIAPIYVGELVLGLGVLATIRLARRTWHGLELLVIVFMLWGAARTLPYISTYGIDALRDGVLWGYGGFALAASVSARPEHFERLRQLYARLVPFFLAWVGVSAVLSLAPSLPTIPGSDVGVVFFKGGDMGVHLAGVIAFLIVALWPGSLAAASLRATLLVPLWVIAVGVAGSLNRGGLFASLCGWIAAFLIRPPTRWWFSFAAAAVVLVGAVFADATLDLGKTRTISLDQLAANVGSVLSDTGTANLDGTRDFRLRWWHDIFDYTVGGQYFWTGKGFGVNLADDDGYQFKSDDSVRAPHNSHMTVLARMGVPGFVMWLAMQLWFGVLLVRAFFASRRAGMHLWCRIDAWLLAYWLAILVNTSFDPYLEGPQGGIWFWSILGLGLAAVRHQQAAIAARGGGSV